MQPNMHPALTSIPQCCIKWESGSAGAARLEPRHAEMETEGSGFKDIFILSYSEAKTSLDDMTSCQEETAGVGKYQHRINKVMGR